MTISSSCRHTCPAGPRGVGKTRPDEKRRQSVGLQPNVILLMIQALAKIHQKQPTATIKHTAEAKTDGPGPIVRLDVSENTTI